MGLLRITLVVAALALSGQVGADGGRGHDRDRDHRGGDEDRDHRGGDEDRDHRGWERHHQPPAWGHHQYRHGHWDRAPRQHYSNQRYYDQRYYNQYYYAPPAAYGYVAPAPGVHIVTPHIYIPLR